MLGAAMRVAYMVSASMPGILPNTPLKVERNKLVLRLQQPVSTELIAEMEAEFSDILLEDQIVSSGPLPEERDEPLLAQLPRLVLRFNRRSLGRLRQLIDSINAGRIMVPQRGE